MNAPRTHDAYLLTKAHQKFAAARVVSKILLQYMIMYCHVLNNEDSSESFEVEGTSDVSKESAPAPTANDLALIFLDGPTQLCL